MASSSTMATVPVVSSEVNDEENRSVVITHVGGSESLLKDVVGARFRPSDEVLAGHYLTKKVSGCTDGPIFPLIKEVDVYQYEPWHLRSRAHDFGDGTMYFFTPVKMKFDKGTKVNRLAGDGFWKKTGNSSDIKVKDGIRTTTIATKTPLAYFKNGQKPGESVKTQWLMKEFILEKQSDEKSKTLLALCVVYLLDRKRKQCESDQNVFCDDVVEGSSEIFAENLVPSADQNPDFQRKCHCPSFGLDGIFSDQIPMSNDQNQNKAYYSKAQSDTSSNPSVNLESFLADKITFANSEQNLSNTVMESQGTADPNVHIPNYDQNPLPDLGFFLTNSGDYQDQFINDLLADQLPQPGPYEDNNLLFYSYNLLVNPPEPLLSPVLNEY